MRVPKSNESLRIKVGKRELNEVDHLKYLGSVIIRDMYCTSEETWAGHVARMEEDRSAFKILTGNPTGKRPLGRPRRRWEDNIRMDHEEINMNAGNWVDSA